MNGFQKFLCVVDRHEKTNFCVLELFWLRLFFDLFSDLMDQKMAGAKKVVIIKKISFFMPVNHTKEFLKSIHISVVIL